MPSEAQVLDRVFRSFAHATRRSVVERLAARAESMSELAKPYDMALPSFLQHLRVLEDAGLIESEKHGRVRTYQIQTPKILLAENWLDLQRRTWGDRFNQFDDLLHRLHEDPTHE